MHYVLSGRDVEKINGLLRTRPGDGSGPGVKHLGFADEFPPPFTVRWSSRESYTEVSEESPATGAWCVWLADPARVLFRGSYITVTGVTAADNLPEGWYKIDDAEEMSGTEGTVVIDVLTGVMTVVDTSETASSSDVRIAWFDTDAYTGLKTVKQYVEGAIVIDGGGCWDVRYSESEETDETTGDPVTVVRHVFGNQFYLDGEGLVSELSLTNAVEDFVCQGDPSSGEEYSTDDRPYVCLAIPARVNSGSDTPMLVGYQNMAEMQEAQRNFAWVIKPLYKFRHNGSVAVDFRNVPNMQLAEVG